MLEPRVRQRKVDSKPVLTPAPIPIPSRYLSTMAATREKEQSEPTGATLFLERSSTFLRRCGVETHGIAPIAKEHRVDRRNYQLFMLWFAANLNASNLVVGAGGPVAFDLSFRNTAYNLLITDVLSLIIPAYFAIFGPKLGTRAMVQGRYSWGYLLPQNHPRYIAHKYRTSVYGIVLPSILNVLTMMGYLFLGLIIGGQMLAKTSEHLTPNLGIVINGLLSLVLSFCGYKILHWFAYTAWIPTLLGFAVMLGVGRKHLPYADTKVYPPPTAASTLSFAATVAASNLSWCTMTPDYGVYHDADGSSAMIFTYTYLGMFLPSIVTHVLGAAFAAAAPGVPSWDAGYDGGNDLGGLVSAVLQPCGGFGKCLLVLMVISTVAVNAPTMYSFGVSLMNISTAFARIPRYVFAIVATADCTSCIPLAVVGQTRFYASLVAFLDIIGYWCASYAGIVFIEHVVFRRRDFARYKMEDWDNAKKLPPGWLRFCRSADPSRSLYRACSRRGTPGPSPKRGPGISAFWLGFSGRALYMGS
ncbi:permease for cytosine/purines, uracil, thiamine, allantoin-domain-containing protein [Mycena galericulata]|nr:permease for cytosine/purines, uracil, thiamine, allantoin-domain-containing protein [Mycena galericulata]